MQYVRKLKRWQDNYHWQIICGAKWQDLKDAKKDSAYQELNDMEIPYAPPALGPYNLIGTSLEEARAKIQQELFNSDEYNDAEAKYKNELSKANITEYDLQNARRQIDSRRQEYKQGQESLRQDCMKQLGVESLIEAREQVGDVRNNLRTPQEVQQITAFLKEPKNNAILRGMEEQIKGERQEKNSTQEGPDQDDGNR